MTARHRRRLPGFRFAAQPLEAPEPLPRMDVAAFVGFAASGPLHTPVAVDDVAAFAAVFGNDASLAWDPERGEEVRAHLGPAVRSFFANGGRRAWIVRVAADTARVNVFPVPGLAAVAFAADGSGRAVALAPAFVRARSAGSWSDGVEVGADLLARSCTVLDSADGDGLAVAAGSCDVGDLLRVAFGEDEDAATHVRFLEVGEMRATTAGSPPEAALSVRGRSVWLDVAPFAASPPPAGAVSARIYTHAPRGAVIADATHVESDPIPGRLAAADASDRRGTLALDLAAAGLNRADAPAPGSLVRIVGGGRDLWMTVDVAQVAGADDAGGAAVHLEGDVVALLPEAPPVVLPRVAAADVVTFGLEARHGREYAIRLSELGLTPGHRRDWQVLPSDEELYGLKASGDAVGRVELAFDYEIAELWRSAPDQRFPLAAGVGSPTLCVPVGMALGRARRLGCTRRTETARERDGLDRFDATLFIDPDLHPDDVRPAALVARADFLRYTGPSPRTLRGLHAILGAADGGREDDATLIAVPDAVHRPWAPAEPAAMTPPALSPSPPRPRWWRFLRCDPPPAIPAVPDPPWGNFLDCAIAVVPAPTLVASGPFGTSRTFTLAWSIAPSTAGAAPRYVLEESVRADFSDTHTAYVGNDTRHVVRDRPPGDYYYRVRAEIGADTSDWSRAVGVRVGGGGRYTVAPASLYSPETLLTIERAVLAACAGRGDLFGVLALPEHYTENDAIAHARALAAPQSGIAPHALSYGALYHPWLVGRDVGSDALRRMPPDGAACGVLAARAIARGAWIAPANEPLRGVVALTPPLAPERWADLQDAQVNVVRHEPRGFLALSADTLAGADDADVRPINVRRLLMLLRRLALRLGPRYVFEPNGDALRRLVQRGFESLLGDMFARGAFAGATPASAFQVVTGATLDTQGSVDAGRFVVELRVAPSLPLTFVSVRLVQSGDRGFRAEGR